MPGIDELLANNRRFVERVPVAISTRGRRGDWPSSPARTPGWMFSALWDSSRQAHNSRNAGGIVSDDVIRSLAISPPWYVEVEANVRQ